MSTIIKPAALFIALGLMGGVANAQNKEDGSTGKDKTIVIRPDKDSKEKYTIVVDGDKVTINGKPVDEFKSQGIDITRGNPRGRTEQFEGFPFRGGWNMIRPDGAAPSVNKALLGVMTEKAETGARVKEVNKESAAEKAGLKEGDVITKINDTKIESPEALHKAVSQFKPDDKVTISYIRDGKAEKTTATLTKNTAVASAPQMLFDNKEFDLKNFEPGLRNFRFEGNARKPRLGMQIQDMENGNGVKVTDIDDESAASRAGLKEDDVITSVNGNTVNSVADVKKELAGNKENEEVKIGYMRGNKAQTATLKFPKKLQTAEL